MRKRTLVVSVSILLCCPRTLCGEPLDAPFMVVIDNHDWDVKRMIDLFSLVSESSPEGSFKVPTESEIRKHRAYRFDELDPSEFVTGLAYCLSRTGKVIRYRFRTMQTEDQFHAFMKREVERRGAATKVSGDLTKIKLSNPPGVRDPSQPRSVPVISWRDSYWGWEDGILVWGEDPAILEVSGPTLLDHVRRGRGKDWYWYVDPSVVPISLRRSLFQQFAAFAGTRMQKRDAEEDAEHAIRRAFGQNAIDIVESLMFDVTTVIASRRNPTHSGPFEAAIVVNIKPGSFLAQTLRELNSRRTPLTVVPQGVNLSATIDIGLPSMVRDGLRAMVSNSRVDGTAMGRALLHMIDDGTFQFASWMIADSEGAAVAGVMPSPVVSIASTDLTEMFGGIVSESGEAVVPISSHFFGDLLPVDALAVVVEDSQLRISVPLDGTPPDTALTEKPSTLPGMREPAALLSVHCDLGPWTEQEDGGPSIQLLTKLEKMYQHWFVYRWEEKYREYLFGAASPDVPLTSVRDQLRAAGDNSLHFHLTAARNGTFLRADCAIGRELFGLLLARHRLTGRDAEPGSNVRRVRR